MTWVGPVLRIALAKVGRSGDDGGDVLVESTVSLTQSGGKLIDRLVALEE